MRGFVSIRTILPDGVSGGPWRVRGLDGPKRTLLEAVRWSRFAVIRAGEDPGSGAWPRTRRQDVSEQPRVGGISKRLSMGPASQFQPDGYEGTCSLRGNQDKVLAIVVALPMMQKPVEESLK